MTVRDARRRCRIIRRKMRATIASGTIPILPSGLRVGLVPKSLTPWPAR